VTSQIDVTVPWYGNPTTESERANWQFAADEISALQAAVQNLEFHAYVLPVANTQTLGGIRSDGVTLQIDQEGVASVPASGVVSFNTRQGNITLLAPDVSSAQGYTSYDATNPQQYQTLAQVTAFGALATPLMDGAANVGSAILFAREDHVHPIDGSRYAASNPANFQSDLQVAASLNALLGANLPLIAGAATVGAATRYSREDHVHPVDTSRYDALNPAHYQSDTQVAASIGSAVANYVPLTQRGSANGVSTLDASGRIPSTQLPAAATGTVRYMGVWNPSTNTPSATSGALMGGVTQAAGNYWVASVAGTTAAIDTITTWNANDWIISNGTTWERVQTAATPYLPLAGGTLSSPATIAGIAGLTFTTTDAFGPTSSLIPDAAEVWLDSAGNIALQLSSQGVLYAAGLNAPQAALTGASITLIADPVNPLDAATKQYFDNARANTLPAMAASATAGTALTVSRSDHVHPTDSSRAPVVSPVFQTSVGLGSDAWMTALEPDLATSWRDTNGNIAGWIDYNGAMAVASLYAATFSTNTLSGLTSLSATTATFGTTVTANETVTDQIMPDLIGAVQGANGNIIFGFDALTGETNTASLNVQNAIKIAGVPFNTTPISAPTDAIDVRAAPYNAVGDGQSNHGYVSTTGNVLTLMNFTGNVTLAATDANTTRLDIDSQRYQGWAFQARHTGKLLYLDLGGGVTVLARVKTYIGGSAVALDTTGMTIAPVSAVPGALVVPAVDVTASPVNKVLLVEGMGQDSYYTQTPTVTRKLDTVSPYGTHVYIATITAFLAPNQIQITPTTFPFSWTNTPTRVLWGTNDSVAAINCAIDAFPSKRRIWFSGDRLYLLPNAGQDNAGHPAYMSSPPGNPGQLFNGVIWAGDNSEVYVATTGGRKMPQRVSPVWAPSYNAVPKMCHGRMSFPRCSQVPASQPLNVLFDGDSLSAFNPQGQVQLVMGAMRFIAEFKAQNPGRTINFYNIGVGGATWTSVNDPRGAYNANSGGPAKYGVYPKPIVGTVGRTTFWQNVNRTATSATNPIVPDLVVLFCCAGNDRMSFDGLAMHATINQVRNIPHTDAYGPTDVVMQTDHHATMIIGMTNGVWDGIAPPGWAAACLDEYYSMGMNRTTAFNRGFAFIDYMPLQNRQAYGYDPTRRGMRQVPQVTLTPAPGAPAGLAETGIDFAFYLTMPTATSDDLGWQALQQLEIQLSQNPGNRLFIRRGPTGTLWVGSSAYGLTVDTTVTVTAGQTGITLGAAQSYTANVGLSSAWPAAWCTDSSIVFTAAMQDKCVIWRSSNMGAGAQGRLIQRNYIRTFIDGNNVLLHEVPHDNNDVAIAETFTLGANQFIGQDANGQTDIVIFYPDGTVFNTQVAYGTTATATTATMASPAPQSLSGQTVPLFLGRMGLKWFDTGLAPSTTTNTGAFTISVIRGELAMGYAPVYQVDLPMDPVMRTLERFGGNYNPVFYSKGAQQITLVNRWIDDDVPVQASTPAWYQRGVITTDSDWAMGGTGGHYGASMRTTVLDALYSTQNLSVS